MFPKRLRKLGLALGLELELEMDLELRLDLELRPEQKLGMRERREWYFQN